MIARSAWKAGFPGQIPDRLVIAGELKHNVIELEGHELVAVELGHTAADYTTCLHVPSIGLVLAGDAVYNDVHLYLAESNARRCADSNRSQEGHGPWRTIERFSLPE